MVRGKPAAHTITMSVSAIGEMERGKEKGVGGGRKDINGRENDGKEKGEKEESE